MLKAIFGIAITLLIMVTVGVVMGFIYLFTLVPFWVGIVSVIVYVLLLVVFIALLWKFLDKLKVDIEEFIAKIKEFVADAIEQIKQMSITDIIKIIYKLLKK